MKPTALKHKIRIMEPTYSDEEYGGQSLNPAELWNEIVVCWAAYRDLSGSEFFAAQQINSKLTGEFKVRYNAAKNVKSFHKIIWGEKIFDIAGPPRDIDGKKQWLYINAEVVE